MNRPPPFPADASRKRIFQYGYHWWVEPANRNGRTILYVTGTQRHYNSGTLRYHGIDMLCYRIIDTLCCVFLRHRAFQVLPFQLAPRTLVVQRQRTRGGPPLRAVRRSSQHRAGDDAGGYDLWWWPGSEQATTKCYCSATPKGTLALVCSCRRRHLHTPTSCAAICTRLHLRYAHATSASRRLLLCTRHSPPSAHATICTHHLHIQPSAPPFSHATSASREREREIDRQTDREAIVQALPA
jgi:hypothetical protein